VAGIKPVYSNIVRPNLSFNRTRHRRGFYCSSEREHHCFVARLAGAPVNFVR